MDTRRKILKPAEAEATARLLRGNGAVLKIVTGHFDPLLAEHAHRLNRSKEGASALMVVVTSPPEPILPAWARAELVAALSVVDYVVLPEEDAVERMLSRIPATEIVRQESADERIARDLIQHVRNRRQES